ncbi:hypothetical protein F4859DRAFT_306136 [Xylaria cf. heliscus]|nr:hypothetical protein F4859DRAFT_306136 [Xylaria cf. heliscus]
MYIYGVCVRPSPAHSRWPTSCPARALPPPNGYCTAEVPPGANRGMQATNCYIKSATTLGSLHPPPSPPRHEHLQISPAPRFFSWYESATNLRITKYRTWCRGPGCWSRHTEETRENDRTRGSKRCEMRCYAAGITRSADRIVSGGNETPWVVSKTCCSRDSFGVRLPTLTHVRTHVDTTLVACLAAKGRSLPCTRNHISAAVSSCSNACL